MGGVFSVFVPQGAVGILAGVFLLVLIAVVTGQAEGVWLAMALVAFGLLAVLMVRAIRRDLRRDDRRPARREATLPDDSELSDEERREAMQRYRDGGRDGR
jgi:membrane protein implicated in regulation of membrane protease activity